jgi:hypothetical protein
MAQVYKRIANPYMPNGTPDKTNAPSPIYAPGELGCYFNDENTGGAYLRVQVDSGATPSTGIGHSPQAGEVAYWKDARPGIAIVTNDKAQCDLGATAAPNRIAGVFQLAPTVTPNVNGSNGQPLMYTTDLLIKSGPNPGLVQCSGSPTAGQTGSGNTGANTANTVATAAGTATPSQILGVFTGGASSVVGSATVYPCDVNVGFAD